MPEEIDFIRAAIASPDDDALRLAYSDWLEEQGGEVNEGKAAFVRLQVRRARMPLADPERPTLLEEEAILRGWYGRKWNAVLHQYLHRQGFANQVDARRGLIRRWDYHRGMVGRLTVSAEALIRAPEVVFSLGPIVCLRISFAHWDHSDSFQIPLALISRLRAVVIAGAPGSLAPVVQRRVGNLDTVPLLDLRMGSGGAQMGQRLRRGKQVILFQTDAGKGMVDPLGKWPGLRDWYVDLTGEALSPRLYQGATT